jgi:phosphatidylcholine synthase
MMTPDSWFNGFPAAWNFVVPTLFLLKASGIVSAVFVVGLGVLQLSSVKFVHPVRVREFRAFTLICTMTWFFALVALSGSALHMPPWGPVVLFVGPIYTVGLTIYRNLAEHSSTAAVLSS